MEIGLVSLVGLVVWRGPGCAGVQLPVLLTPRWRLRSAALTLHRTARQLAQLRERFVCNRYSGQHERNIEMETDNQTCCVGEGKILLG